LVFLKEDGLVFSSFTADKEARGVGVFGEAVIGSFSSSESETGKNSSGSSFGGGSKTTEGERLIVRRSTLFALFF
jgi:hypothetical protein